MSFAFRVRATFLPRISWPGLTIYYSLGGSGIGEQHPPSPGRSANSIISIAIKECRACTKAGAVSDSTGQPSASVTRLALDLFLLFELSTALSSQDDVSAVLTCDRRILFFAFLLFCAPSHSLYCEKRPRDSHYSRLAIGCPMARKKGGNRYVHRL